MSSRNTNLSLSRQDTRRSARQQSSAEKPPARYDLRSQPKASTSKEKGGKNPAESFSFTLPDENRSKSNPKFRVPAVPKFDPTVLPPPPPIALRNLVPNFPPPAIPSTTRLAAKSSFTSIFGGAASTIRCNTASSSVFEPVSAKNQTDQEILNNFLRKHGYHPDKPDGEVDAQPMDIDVVEVQDPKMTIDLAQTILSKSQNKINKMIRLRCFMEKNVDLIPDSEWEIKKQNLEVLRKEISEILHPLLEPAAIEELQEKLNKRQLKRTWLQNKKTAYQSEKQMKQERRVERMKFVEECNARLEQLEKESRDKELEKKAATDLLEVVKKRIRETQEYLAIFSRLKELYRARMVADGGNSHSTEDFNQKIDELKAVWEDLLMEEEEQKMTLDTIIDRRTSNDSLLTVPKTTEAQWLETIFGPDSIRDTENPYLAAERDLNSFLEIRTLWDKFLVPEHSPAGVGSSIPIFWALPSQNPSSAWRQYRRINNPLNDIPDVHPGNLK
ncbi:hypothetical protein DMENIID0001_058000 [Sergentomyia squamirostris]